MSLRRIASLTGLISFLVVLLTSIVLYISPHGRVAYWADWRFWGLSKDEWANVHINVGLLFLLALLLHVYYNWKPILTYLKDKARHLRFFTAEMNIALALTAVFTIGTLAFVPPFSSILDFSESLKEAAARTYGEPPWGHAELSPIATFAKKMGWDPQRAIEVLEANGFAVANPNQTLKELAALKGIPPQDVYHVLQNALQTESAPEGKLPDAPPPGFGQKSLQAIAAEYGVSLAAMQQALQNKGINAPADKSLKSIAEDNGQNPYLLFDILREATDVSAPPQSNAAPAASSAAGQGRGQGAGKGKSQDGAQQLKE